MVNVKTKTLLRVVNVRKLKTPEQRAGVVYVGRACGGWPASKYRNPHKLKQFATPGDRVACVELFACDFLARSSAAIVADLKELYTLSDRGRLPLGCWCCDWNPAAPRGGELPACHAVELAKLVNTAVMAGAIA
jgi:hypothetical protein